MNDLRLQHITVSQILIILVVNMEITIPICLRPKELVEPVGLLIHCLILTAVLQCLCLFHYVQKFLVNSYRKKLNQHQIVAGSFKSGCFAVMCFGAVGIHIHGGRTHFCSAKDAKVFPLTQTQ